MNKIALHLMERKQQSLCPLVRVYSILEIQTQWFSVRSAPCGILCFLSRNCQLQLVEPCRQFWKTVSYTCGASLHDLDLPDSLSCIVIRSHQRGDAIERLYYSAAYEDVCIFCATTSDLVQSLLDSVYPICYSCQETNQPVQKRKKCLSLIFVFLFCVLFSRRFSINRFFIR